VLKEVSLLVLISSFMIPTVTDVNLYVNGTGAELDFRESKYANSQDYRDSCRDTGYDDGRNGPFDNDKYDECGRFYYDAFIDGCISADNTIDVCESATDA
jgi:hypothetical protein